MSVSYKDAKLFFDYVRDIIDKNRDLDLLDSQPDRKIHSIEGEFEEIVSLVLEGNTAKADEILSEIMKDTFFLGKSTIDQSTQKMISSVEALLADLSIERKRTYEGELKKIISNRSQVLPYILSEFWSFQ